MKAPRPIAAVILLFVAVLITWKPWEDHTPFHSRGQPGADNTALTRPGAAGGPLRAVSSSGISPAAVPTDSTAEATPGAAPAGEAAIAPAAAPAAVVRRCFAPAPATARLPLVFALPPEEMTGLNQRQAAAAVAIADQFFNTLGGESADPSTTDYRDRWKREQPLADYQLRAAIGAQAYARWQEAAYLRAKAAASQ